jgi:hypothetical protein
LRDHPFAQDDYRERHAKNDRRHGRSHTESDRPALLSFLAFPQPTFLPREQQPRLELVLDARDAHVELQAFVDFVVLDAPGFASILSILAVSRSSSSERLVRKSEISSCTLPR